MIAYGPAADRLAVGCMQHVDKATLALGNAPVLIGSVTPDGILMFDYLGDHMSDVGAIAFSPDGAKLITGSCPLPGEAPAEMICWDVGTPSRPRWRVAYPAAVTAISVSPDGKRFVVGGADGLLRLFSIDQPLEAIAAANVGETVGSVAYAHHTALVAVTDSTDRVRVFDVADDLLSPRAHFVQPGAALSPLAFAPTDDTLYVRGDRGIERCDVRTMKSIDPVIAFVDGVSTFNVSSMPEAVIAVTNAGKMILRTVSR